MAESYLVLFDADRIRDYVFATGRLKEIRGASEIVRRATAPDRVRSLAGVGDWREGGEGLIFAGGAAGALVVEGAERARQLCFDLEQSYRRETGAATLSAVAVAVEGETHTAQAEAQRRADLALAARKQSRPRAESPPGGGPLRYCASDRLTPASVRAPEPGGAGGALVSEATARKRLASQEYRRLLRSNPAWRAFLQELPAQRRRAWAQAINPSQDLGDIGALAHPRGYVALVYVDGDSAGKALRQAISQGGFSGYQTFSEALSTAAVEATASALAEAYGAGVPGGSLPFELITIGGDDVVLVCTAERGLAIAVEVCRRLGARVNERLAEAGIALAQPFSASAGVVIAHDSLPIVLLERRAYDLLRSAKRAGPGGGVDFYVVTTPGLERIDQIRARDYSAEAGRTRFTARPLSLERMGQLIGYARHLRGLCDLQGTPRHDLSPAQQARLAELPRSKVADLYAACQGTRAQATLNVLTVHARLAEHERRAVLHALRDLGCVAHYPFAAPDQGVSASALPDLLEALEFVAEEGIWTR